MKQQEFRFGERRERGTALVLIVGVFLGMLVVRGSAVADECAGTITAEEALRAEDARYQAQIANDMATLERLLGPDLVYIHSSAAMDSKTSYLESLRSGTVTYRAMRRSAVTVRTYGCLAMITGNAAFDVTTKGEDLSIQLRCHSVWAKRPQGVQFVSWQATRLPPTP